MSSAPGLDAGLLVRREDELVFAQGGALPVSFVEIEDPPGFAPKVRIAREDPTAVPPGANGILVQPAPHGFVADACTRFDYGKGLPGC